jgi:pimeloyl-ACP methyl ester carboxylesterase
MEYAVRHPERVSYLILMHAGPASHDDYLLFREKRCRRMPNDIAQLETRSPGLVYAADDCAAEAAFYRVHVGRRLGNRSSVRG